MHIYPIIQKKGKGQKCKSRRLDVFRMSVSMSNGLRARCLSKTPVSSADSTHVLSHNHNQQTHQNCMLDLNYCIAVLNKKVSQLIVNFHVQLVNHIVWLFYGGKFPFTLNIVDLPSSLLSIKTSNRLLGSKRHFGVSKWMLVVLDQYNRLGG